MKTTLVRSFVVALAVIGFTASTVSASAKKTAVNKTVTLGILSSPTPMCPIGDKNGCGIL